MLKSEGGLGIRDLFEWNRASILYQIWRFTQPSRDSIWLLWLHNCMFKKRAFWTTKIPYKCSWSVRKMLNHREVAMQYLNFKLGEGSSFLLWHDPWLIRKPLLEHFGNHIISAAESSNLARVSSIILNGTWAPSSSNHVLVIEFRRLLSHHSISTCDDTNWAGTKPVNLSVIWNSIPRVASPPLWIGAIYHTLAIKNCSLYLWLALRGRLLTKDRMRSFGFNVDMRCVLCHSSEETADHLFADCPYTFLLIRACPVSLSHAWSDWQNGNFFSRQHQNWLKQLGYLFISVMTYNVWRERNNRIHSNARSRPVNQLLFCIKQMVRERVFSSNSIKKQLIRDPSISALLY